MHRRQYIIGMAGHIDHGKTALIQALTGINTDRLKEEQERGITINLGFAHFSDHVTIIDVPGHERLIKNMVAGVSTIDMVLFVVAADDGIMPQTREHFDIIKLLGIPRGIFVITKIDLVEAEWVDLVEEEIRNLVRGSLLEDAPILRASAVNGDGVETVRQAIIRMLEAVPERRDDGIFRLPIDRVFTKAGFGTIVTGSVLSGSARVGDELEVIPLQKKVRVRGIQSHDRSVEEVTASFRAAINLAGVEAGELERGEVLCTPDYFRPVEMFNARVVVLPDSPIPLKNQMRLRIHLHTAETFARILLPENRFLSPGEETYAQLRLEKPIYACYRDRFIIRQFSPQVTLGGGMVLEVNPPKYRKKFHRMFIEKLQMLEGENTEKRILAAFSRNSPDPLTLPKIQIKTGLTESEAQSKIEALLDAKELFLIREGKSELYLSRRQVEQALQTVVETLQRYHQEHAERNGLKSGELKTLLKSRITENVLNLILKFGVEQQKIKQVGDYYADFTFEPVRDSRLGQLMQQIETRYRASGFTPLLSKEIMEEMQIAPREFQEATRLLREQGKLVFLTEELLVHSTVIERLVQEIGQFFRSHTELTVPEFKEMTGTTRKYAIPLLTYLDNQGYTRREGDVRVKGPRLD